MSGTGGSGQPAQASTPWAGISQAAGSNSVQSTPGAAMPPVPGQTPGAAATPYQPPSMPVSGFTPQGTDQSVDPSGMQTGMPQINAQTGTGSFVGAPAYMTQPAPPPAGYGLGPGGQQPGQPMPGQGGPPPGQVAPGQNTGYMPQTLGTGGGR